MYVSTFKNSVGRTSNTLVSSSHYFHLAIYHIKVFSFTFIMKFVLIAIIFTTLHYESSQYDVYSQLFRPYSSYRYVRTQRTMPTMPTTMPTMSTMPTMRSTLSTMRPTMPTMRPTMLTTRPTMSTVSTTMFRYAQPPTIRYGVYRNFTPENRGLVVLKKVKHFFYNCFDRDSLNACCLRRRMPIRCKVIWIICCLE